MSDSEQQTVAETMVADTTEAEETAVESPAEPELEEDSVVVTDETPAEVESEEAMEAPTEEAAAETGETPAVATVEAPESMEPETRSSESEPVPEVDPETKAAIDELDADLPDDIDSPKVLVRDLAPTTTETQLKEHFSKFGEVRVAKLKKDSEGTSKGIAFIIFSDNSNITKAVQEAEQEIDGATAKLSKAMPSADKMKTNKLFVGGLPAALSEEQLKMYFEKYGKIQNFQFILNKMTNSRKAFCFILFESPESVEKITEGKIPPNSVVHTIEGHTVDCKKKFDEDHPVQRKIKARSQQYNSNRNQNYQNYNQGQYDPSAYAGYAGYGGAYPGYEQYYGAYGAYGAYAGYPGYGYAGYPGYPGYAYPQGYGSAYGPVKPARSGGNYKPY